MKLLLACTSGGHFSTMRDLESFWTQHDRVWLTDFKQDTDAISAIEDIYWLPYQGPRDVVTFFRNFPEIFRIVAYQRPDIIVSTGASIAVSSAIVAQLLGIKFIFIESLTRSQNLSLSGKLVYYLSDEFYVQWPDLCERYPRAKFKGVTVSWIAMLLSMSAFELLYA